MSAMLLARIVADGRRMKILRSDADRLGVGGGIAREEATNCLLDLITIAERWRIDHTIVR